MPTREQIEVGAKALWEATPHTLLERNGYPTDWESLTRGLRWEFIRKANAVLEAVELTTTDTAPKGEEK